MDTLFESRNSIVPMRRIYNNLGRDYTIRHHLQALFQLEQRRKWKMHKWTQHRFPFFWKLHLTPIIVNKYSTDNLLTKRIRDLTWDYNVIPFQSRDVPMNDFDWDILKIVMMVLRVDDRHIRKHVLWSSQWIMCSQCK